MTRPWKIPPLEPEEVASLPFLLVRVATLLSIPQLHEVLTWTSLTPTWRAMFEQHLRWAEAAPFGIRDGGDQP